MGPLGVGAAKASQFESSTEVQGNIGSSGGKYLKLMGNGLCECFRFARFRGARKPVSRYGLFAAESSKPRVELNRRLRPAL